VAYNIGYGVADASKPQEDVGCPLEQQSAKEKADDKVSLSQKNIIIMKNTLSLSVSLSHTHTRSLSLSLSPSFTHSVCPPRAAVCQGVSRRTGLSHTHALSRPLSLSLTHVSLSHTDCLSLSHSLSLTLALSLAVSHTHALSVSLSLTVCLSPLAQSDEKKGKPSAKDKEMAVRRSAPYPKSSTKVVILPVHVL